jgi:hypothetical protein
MILSRLLFVIQSVVMPGIFLLSVVMLNVIMLSIVESKMLEIEMLCSVYFSLKLKSINKKKQTLTCT